MALLSSLAVVCAREGAPGEGRPPPRGLRRRAAAASPRSPRVAAFAQSRAVTRRPERAAARDAAADPDRTVARRADAARPEDGGADRVRPRLRPPGDRRRDAAGPPRAGHRPVAADCRRAARRRDVPPAPGGERRLDALGGAAAAHAPVPASDALQGDAARRTSAAAGLDFRQGSFRFGVSNETKAMMGGGVCWIDYNGDGLLDLFAVNSYASADIERWQAHGGLPTSELFESTGARFRNVTAKAHAGLAVQGDGCAAGRPERRRPHRPRRLDDHRRRRALEHRPRLVHRGDAAGAERLVHGYRRRRRERRRSPGRLRRRLRRPERAGGRIDRRLPDEPRGRPRPPVPEPAATAGSARSAWTPGSRPRASVTASAPSSWTRTATGAPISTSRTTRTRTTCT